MPSLVLGWSSTIDDPMKGWPRELEANMKRIGHSVVITMDRLPDTQLLGQAHPYLLQTLVHEMLHAYTHLQLEIPVYNPGWALRMETNILLNEEVTRSMRYRFSNLSEVINEAISLAFEVEIIAAILTYTEDHKAIIYLKLWLRHRVIFLRSVRDRKTDRDFDNNAYYEAYSLAIQLKKNGWTLQDIPFLLCFVKNFTQITTGVKYSGEVLESIGYTTEWSDSTYQKIIQKLKKLER